MNNTKRILRKELAIVRSNIQNAAQLNNIIFSKATSLVGSLMCKKIFTYISIGNEVDTKQIISYYFSMEGYKVFVPYTKNEAMTHVKLKSLECLNADKLGNLSSSSFFEHTDEYPDIVFVPLLGFNSLNYRLGYGGGYYDKYLADSKAVSVGLAFSEQFCVKLEPEPFDVPLDYIITPDTIIKREI